MRSAASVLLFALFLLSACASAAPPTKAPAAPPRRCEIRLSAWCIAEGAYEITRQLANDSVHDRVWSMRGRFRPESNLVILEPNGCRSGFSDALELLKFERGVQWENRSWDRLQARLKSDGSCDLTVLLPPMTAIQWSGRSQMGLLLVRPCKDDACESAGLAELRPQFEKQFRAERR